MVRSSQGLTLAELLVVVMVFSILMTLVLGFYLYGIQVSDKRDQDSDQYRRGVTLLNRLEARLDGAVVHAVAYANDAVVFTPAHDQEIGTGRSVRFSAQAITLAVIDGRVTEIQGQEQSTLIQLQTWEKLTFQLPGTERPDYLDILYQADPPKSPKVHNLTRRLVVERF